MSSIQFSGVSSSLDTKSIIDALMTAEQAPLTRLKTAESDLTARRNALLDVRAKFSDLLTKLRVFTESKVGSSMGATSSNSAAFTATATSSAVNGAYSVTVNHLATATVARSTAAVGTAVTDGSQFIADLPLRGTVTAGTAGVVVDGAVLHVTVGDPASTSLDSLGTAIASAMTAQASSTDPGATFTYSIVDNRLQFAASGGSASHTVSFGVAGDTSNALGILGLTNAGGTVSAGGTLTATTLLGVAQATKTLGTAFAALAGQTGTLTVNGVGFAWDASTETLNGILARINSSTAGVIASIDRTNDRIVLSAKTAGATALDIRDTSGALAATLNLGPGTTAAQTMGSNAQVTVNGAAYTSATNQVTNAIDGVTLNLVGESTTPATLTVASDRTAVKTALQNVVDAYNTAVDTVASYSANDPGTTKGVLAANSMVSGLLSSVRSLFFTPTTAAGPYNNLSAIGVNSGVIGSAMGTTTHLSLDSSKLDAAFDANPAAVSTLLGSLTTGALKPIADRINTYAGAGGIFYQQTQAMAETMTGYVKQEASLQSIIDDRRAYLEAKYAAMESLLSRLQTTSNSLTATTNASSDSSSG
jgi:flagellar hook-associated protein 2